MASGETSYFGFEYQIYASVLLMLLEHQSSSFSAMIVETPFGYDASIKVDEQKSDEEQVINLALSCVHVKHVQIKTKTRQYMWTASEIRKVLLKQDEASANRTENNVLDNLIARPEETFTFFTDGVVHPDLAGLRTDLFLGSRKHSNLGLDTVIQAISSSSRNSTTNKELSEYLDQGLLEHVFIIDGLDLATLKIHIERIIRSTYRIPFHECPNKMAQLVETVRSCMLRHNNQVQITKDELEEIIGISSPKVPYPELVNAFVATDTYHEAIGILERYHLLIICGEPCIGKTTIARAIVNTHFERDYDYTEISGIDGHLQIAKGYRENANSVYFADDGFGVSSYSEQLVLAEQLPQLLPQLKSAQGRIKLIITTRNNVLAETCASTRLGNIKIDLHIIRVAHPALSHISAVLDRLLSNFSEVDVQAIRSNIEASQFENLLHLRNFIDEMKGREITDEETVREIIELSRPSEYERWIRGQSASNQLLMFLLYMLQETTSAVTRSNLERVFSLAEPLIFIGNNSLFGTIFENSLHDLQYTKNRIEQSHTNKLNFVHPYLRNAVHNYLLGNQPGTKSFLSRLLNTLIIIDGPIEQSVAVVMCVIFQEQLGQEGLAKLTNLINSRYIETAETIIHVGGIASVLDYVISNSDKIDRQMSMHSQVEVLRRQLLYSPEDCIIDETGYLVRRRERSLNTLVDIGEHIDNMHWLLSIRAGDLSENKVIRFNETLANNDFQQLNALEKYEFAHWLFRNRLSIDTKKLHMFIQELASESVSFVRTCTTFFLDIPSILTEGQYNSLFLNLCYDYHPNVKIEILEDIILEYWRYLPSDQQDYWLQIVTDMLDDPIVRTYTAMGLIGQSEHLEYYHENHNNEQKLRWYMAIAPKLLKYEFPHQIDFDNFLTPFDDNFTNLQIPYRTELLAQIISYIEQHKGLSHDTLYSIERIILHGEPSKSECDLCLRLISNLSSWGKARIMFTFAQQYNNLCDIRFKEFIHYPFYNEEENQYVAERCAVLLGILANPDFSILDLPPGLPKSADSSRGDIIQNYALSQNVNFQLMLIMMAYSYGDVYHINGAYYRCFQSNIIDFLVRQFAIKNDLEHCRLVIEIILTKIRVFDEGKIEEQPLQDIKQTKWFHYLELFLYNDNPEVCKIVCELVFALNIASSVHNSKTFLCLAYLVLLHPDNTVSTYAFCLLDQFINKIVDYIFTNRYPQSWQEEINNTWFSDDFQKALFDNSPAYKRWIETSNFFITVYDIWDDLGAETKSYLLNYLIKLFADSAPEIVEIASQFYLQLRHKLSEEEQKLFTEYYQNDRLKREMFADQWQYYRSKLDTYFAKVDWSLYFEE